MAVRFWQEVKVTCNACENKVCKSRNHFHLSKTCSLELSPNHRSLWLHQNSSSQSPDASCWGQESTGNTHPYCGSHEVCTHLCKIPAEDAVIETVKEHGNTKIHGIFRLYSEQETWRRAMFQFRKKGKNILKTQTQWSIFTWWHGCLFLIINDPIKSWANLQTKQ